MLLVFQICLFVAYYYEVQESLNQQMQKELKDECDEAKETIKARMETKLEWLKMAAGLGALSKKVDASEGSAWWKLISEFDTEEGYRIGIADNQGNLFYGSHEKTDISNRDYYIDAMNGQESVSPVIEDSFNGEDGVVLASPILMEDGTPIGAFVVEFTTVRLGGYLNKTDLQGHGVNFIIDSQGRMVASHEEMESYETIYDMLAERDMEDDYSVEQMREGVQNRESGYLEYKAGEHERLLYYQPTGLEDWTVVSIASMESYSGILTRTKRVTVLYIFLSLLVMAGTIYLLVKLLLHRGRELELTKSDDLTGVYTKTEGRRLVEYRLKRKTPVCYGCLFVDMDDFKQINDGMGHEEGDRILREVGQLLRTSLRETDVAYRFGGDEFCVWLFGKGGKTEIQLTANRIMKKAAEVDEKMHFSIGATCVAEGESNFKEILKRADDALYEAKREGKGRVRIR